MGSFGTEKRWTYGLWLNLGNQVDDVEKESGAKWGATLMLCGTSTDV